MSLIVVDINGIRVDEANTTRLIEGLDNFTVSHEIDENGNELKKVTNSLIWHDDENSLTSPYKILKQELIDDPAGKNKSVSVEFFDTCCGGVEKSRFVGIIKGDSLSWCDGQCFIEAEVIEDDEDDQKLDCLASKLVFDNQNGFQSQDHPRVTYCNELRPNWMHDVILILGIFINLIQIILVPIVAAVSLLITIVTIGTFGTGLLDDYLSLIPALKEAITGCGRQHPSPFVRDYIKNVCDICGLTFESSILNDPASQYYDTMYFYAPVEKGTRDSSVKYIEENKPILSGEGFLDEQKLVHNAKWWVDSGVLYYERKDFRPTNSVYVDYEDLKAQGVVVNDKKACYEYNENQQKAYLRMEYSEDEVDLCGNEAKDRYSDIIEWNNPFSKSQVGEEQIILPFGMSRFRDDGIDRDVLTTYEGNVFYSSILSSFKNVLISEKGVSSLPKLLIKDPSTLLSDSKVRRYSIPGFSIPSSQNYNFPYFVNELNVAPNTAYPTDEPNMGIYGRFHSIRHPKAVSIDCYNWTFTFEASCEQIDNFNIRKFVSGLAYGLGDINGASINYSTRTIELKGTI